MKPITFDRSKFIPASPLDIAEEIINVENWSGFEGYAFLPGIKDAAFETQTDDMVGSRIRVRNMDGSQHIEEFLVWEPQTRIVLKLHEFTPPLNRLASHFIEEWTFRPREQGTYVTRSFEMYPKATLSRPFLWVISRLFSRAIAAHMDDIVAIVAQRQTV